MRIGDNMAKKFIKNFRKNKRINHPTYLVDRDGNVYKYIGITHSEITLGKKNIPLKSNPNPEDNKTAYVRPRVEKDKAENFGRRLKGWRFLKEDKKTIKDIVDKDKNKK